MLIWAYQINEIETHPLNLIRLIPARRTEDEIKGGHSCDNFNVLGSHS